MIIEPESKQQPSQRDGIAEMSDHDLNEAIARHSRNIQRLDLPDKGGKLKSKLKQLQDEKERRCLGRLLPDTDGCEMLTKPSGAYSDYSLEAPSSGCHLQSTFASSFSEKLDKNCTDKDCAFRTTKLNAESLHKGKHRVQSSDFSTGNRHIIFNNKEEGGTFSVSHNKVEYVSCGARKRNVSEVIPNDSRPQKIFVVVDEEEPQSRVTTKQADQTSDCMKEQRIYYPSRDDPDSVEICYADIACLVPEAYLSSTIMNFYIRYIQQPKSPVDIARCNYYFFNTYFYKKLREAVSDRGDNETFFIKFRRWWKGVNIFQKAYVFIPIHENHHWSLAIICIPDKEDESGPIILHLDSLRLHCSKSVFSNIKSYLRDEWKYLNQEVAPPDVPIADSVWKQLPSRINEKKLAVPQQKNDYDCGLFVLFFMERFIEEAPHRLKRQDLAMFGNKWFRPEEASALRRKIRNLLIEIFKNASGAVF